MRSRILVYVSIALYLLSLVLPALRQDPSSAEYSAVTMNGLQCAFALMGWGLVFFPLALMWLANPWLWTLWVWTLREKPTHPGWAWPVPVLTVITVGAAMASHQTPLIGTWLWIVATALGSLAATMIPRKPPLVFPAGTRSN